MRVFAQEYQHCAPGSAKHDGQDTPAPASRASGPGISFWDCVTNLYKKSCNAFIRTEGLYVNDPVIDSTGTYKRFGINDLLLTPSQSFDSPSE